MLMGDVVGYNEFVMFVYWVFLFGYLLKVFFVLIVMVNFFEILYVIFKFMVNLEFILLIGNVEFKWFLKMLL